MKRIKSLHIPHYVDAYCLSCGYPFHNGDSCWVTDADELVCCTLCAAAVEEAWSYAILTPPVLPQVEGGGA